MSTQSLPSFAQAFSAIPPTDALPPIMHNRKRAQDDAPDDDDHVRVKEELDDDDPAPPPSALMPAPKKRRVTVSGAAPQPLHIDVRPPHDHQPASTPISPVVIGFPVHRDNPAAMEQVRNMISVKQKQKALIEQRRGSAAGILSPAPPHTPADDRPPIATPPSSHPAPAPLAPAPTPRSSRRSPNHPPTRRTNPPRAPSPPVPTSHHHHPPPPPVPQHSLPPPPISFARRRAAQLGGKRKPADIVISPREAHTRDQLQPAIQSAPPIPQAGAAQGQFSAPRFTMALPRLPTITGNENPRRVAGNVPPTPTRLSMLQHQAQTQHQPPSHAGAQHPQPPHAHIQGQQGGHHPPIGLHPASALGPGGSGPPARSPPASIPIATTLVPPTPTTLTRTGSAYARAGDSDKAAFLAPFELFYEALSDARTLKGWLGDQLRESRALLSSLGTAQERRQESIDAAVERRLAGAHAEMAALRRRVEELEATNRDRDNNNLSNNQAHRQINGGVDAYTFPPQAEAGPSRMRGEPRRPPTPSSGGWEQRERESPQMGRRSVAGRDTPLAGEYKDHRDREREYADREREREREARSSRRNSIAMDGDGDEDSQMRHT